MLLLLLALLIPFLHATALRIPAGGDVVRTVRAIVAELPREARQMVWADAPILRLTGDLHLRFEDDVPVPRVGEVARALAGEARVDDYWVDPSGAHVTLTLLGETIELKAIAGRGTRRRQVHYVRPMPLVYESLTKQIKDLHGYLRRLCAPGVGSRKDGYRLTKSVLIDLRALPPEAQDQVTAVVPEMVSGQAYQGYVLDPGDVRVFVLRHAAPPRTEWRPLPAPVPPARVKFVDNPRFGLEHHLTFLTRTLPLANAREVDGQVRWLGKIELDDSVLASEASARLRAAVGRVLAGERPIAGAWYDATSARVAWVARPCEEDVLH